MSSSKFFLIWPGNPALSIFVWVVIGVVVLYLARTYAHKLITSISHFMHNAMRLAARSVMLGEARLRARNREVLLAAGAEQMERQVEREFHRINNIVIKDFQAYPSLHRSMADLITAVDEDYRRCTDVPPSPPGWANAMDAVTKVPSAEKTLVADMLGVVNKSINKHYRKSIDDYRKATGDRHSLLRRMMPYWRKMSQTLESVDKTVRSLLDRSADVDKKMEQYENILRGNKSAERMLSSSSLTQFVISGIVLLIAIGGAIVNFNLIALPMSEMVGGGSYLGPFKMSNVAAMVIILIETAMGIYFMEAMRITKLFPVIGSMEDRKRRLFMWASLLILTIMACIESSLAFMRDIIASDRQALIQTLAGVAAEGPAGASWIPMVGQMVMGFILPFALAFVAIPFESFVHASRTVLGLVVLGLLRFIAFLLRLVGNIALYSGNILVNVYDLLAFPLLWVERMVRDKDKQAKQTAKT